jgi:hypothetical protein
LFVGSGKLKENVLINPSFYLDQPTGGGAMEQKHPPRVGDSPVGAFSTAAVARVEETSVIGADGSLWFDWQTIGAPGGTRRECSGLTVCRSPLGGQHANYSGGVRQKAAQERPRF